MPKSTSRSNRNTSNKRTSVNNPNPGRPRPMTPKAGVTKHRSRYGNGGEFCY